MWRGGEERPKERPTGRRGKRVAEGASSPVRATNRLTLCSLVSTSNAIQTPRQAVSNTQNVMSRGPLDIVDQIESDRFEPTASSDPRSVDFAHSSLPYHSVTCKQQYAGRR